MRKSIGSILAMFVCILFLPSCGVSKQDALTLIDGRWNITEIKGEKVEGEKIPFIEFDVKEKRLHGNAGCNHFNAAFKVDPSKPGSLQFLPAAATLMACPDMQLEDKVLQAFEDVAAVKKSGEKLQLVDPKEAVVFLLEKAPEQEKTKAMVKLTDLAGEWTLKELNGVISNEYTQLISFDIENSRYSGNAGCNQMSGEFSFDANNPNKITFSKPSTTRMACPRLETENQFLSTLEGVVRLEMNTGSGQGEEISFYDKDNKKTLVVRKK